jgi:hypothetical protein
VRYNENWGWFLGSIWEETVPGAKDKSGNPVYKYPLKINLVKPAAMKHNYVLFGEVPDGPGPLVPCRVKPEEQDEEEAPSPEDRKKAKRVQNMVNRVWEENNGRTLQRGKRANHTDSGRLRLSRRPGIRSARICGTKFGSRWSCRISSLPVWDTTNPDELLEAFIVWRMPAREAMLKYGYEPGKAGTRVKSTHSEPRSGSVY